MKAVKKEIALIAQQYKNVAYDPNMLQINMILKHTSMSITAIANKSGVSKTCIKKWQEQKTRRPQSLTMKFVLRVLGYDLKIVPSIGHNRMPPEED